MTNLIRRRWWASAAVAASILLVVATVATVAAVLSVRSAKPRDSARVAATTAPTVSSSAKVLTFNGVQLTIPASWPVIDGAHAGYSCSSMFLGQSDRAFLGVSYQGAHSCPARPTSVPSPPADGVWMQPGGSTPPQQASTTLAGRQQVYLSSLERASVIAVWYRGVSIELGIGADPAIEQAILNSITYSPTIANSSVLGQCPTPSATATMPAPTRLMAPLSLDVNNGEMQPEPSTVEPKVSAATVWSTFVHSVAANVNGALQWSIVFGSYSAQAPAQINPDGSITPFYRGAPTWLIQGVGIQTDYGPCGVTILAPYSADTGQSMGLTTIGTMPG